MKMVPTCGVTVIRDGKRVTPKIGEAFDFSKEERDSLLEAKPGSLRKPVNESAGDDDDDDAAPKTKATKSSAEASQAAAKDGKKTATANKSDDEADADL